MLNTAPIEMVSHYDLIRFFVGTILSVLGSNIAIMGIILGIIFKIIKHQRAELSKTIKENHDQMFELITDNNQNVLDHITELNDKHGENQQRITVVAGELKTETSERKSYDAGIIKVCNERHGK